LAAVSKFNVEDFLSRFEKDKQERQKRNLESMNEKFHEITGKNLDDVMLKDKKPKSENEEVTEQDVDVKILNRILTVGGPFDKRAHHIPADEERNYVRIIYNFSFVALLIFTDFSFKKFYLVAELIYPIVFFH